MNADLPYWVQRLIAELGRDKKKTVTLAVLAVVAIIVGVRFFLDQSGPDEAQALPVAAVAVVAGQGEEPNNSSLVTGVFQEVSAKRKTKRDEYISEMSREVTRDLFAVDLNIYPLVELPKPIKSKSGKKTSENSKPTIKKPTKEQIVLSQSKLLCLQMTIVSDKSTAIINSQVLGVGDTIDVKLDGGSARFRVVEIASHGCVVARNGVRVVLQMK